MPVFFADSARRLGMVPGGRSGPRNRPQPTRRLVLHAAALPGPGPTLPDGSGHDGCPEDGGQCDADRHARADLQYSYFNGTDPADNESLYSGYNNDTNRSGNGWQPLQDRAGLTDADTFGSAHVGSFNTVFCDGSTHAISYGIDADTHRRLSCINDGEAIDPSKF